MKQTGWLVATGVLVIGAFIACRPTQPDSAEGGTGGNVQVSQGEVLSPLNLRDKKATLLLAGSPVTVDVKTEEAGPTKRLVMMAHGQKLDEEVYQLDPVGLHFVSASGQVFDPPLLLVPLPSDGHDEHKWEGQIMTLPSASRKATAVITLEPEELNTASGLFQTIRVDVALKIDVEAAESQERMLKFWVSPDEGIVRREAGSDWAREPAAPAQPVSNEEQ